MSVFLIVIFVLSNSKSQVKEENSTKIENGYILSIISDSIESDNNRYVETRLNKKPTRSLLENQSNLIFKNSDATVQITYIKYFVDGFESGIIPWALAKFTPELELKIYGLPIELEETFVYSKPKVEFELLGAWIDESPMSVTRITMHKEKEMTMFVKENYNSDFTVLLEAVLVSDFDSAKFKSVYQADYGETYFLTHEGTLIGEDRSGIIFNGRPIEL